MNIGVIPARAGSKRFPGKNRAKLGGLELWKRACILSIRKMDWTIINSDDEKILDNLDKCLGQGYVRPEHLRDGQSYRIDDVLIEMVERLSFKSKDIIYLFQPTSPFISDLTIIECMKQFCIYNDLDSVQSVCRIPNNLHAYSQRLFVGDMNDKYLRVEFVFPKERNNYYNSQLKPPFYAFAGFVGCRVESLLKHKNIWGEKSIGIIVNPIEMIDIDAEEDLRHAEYLTASRIAV